MSTRQRPRWKNGVLRRQGESCSDMSVVVVSSSEDEVQEVPVIDLTQRNMASLRLICLRQSSFVDHSARDFFRMHLALGAEALHRCGRVSAEVQQKYFNLLPRNIHTALVQRQRCMFTWKLDTTSLTLLKHGILPWVPGNDMLQEKAFRNILVGVSVLFTSQRLRHMLSYLDPAMTAETFRDAMLQTCGRVAPSPAIAGALRGMLSRYGHHNAFENGVALAVDLCRRSSASWKALTEARRRSTSNDGTSITKKILRQHLQLGPFVTLIVMRYMSFIDPWFYNENSSTEIGQYARMGIFLLTGMTGADAYEKSIGRHLEEASRLLKELLTHASQELDHLDEDGIVRKLQQLGLQPLKAATFQHLLCEYRKAICSKGRPYRRSQTTPTADYAVLYQNVCHAFL